MGKGKGSSSSSQVKAPEFDSNPANWANMGYQQTMNPFTAQGRPNWMQGHFAMDSWGKSAADPRISLTQDMLSPYGAPIHNEAVRQMGQYDQQVAQGQAPQMPQWMNQYGGQPMTLEQAMAMNARPMQIQPQAPQAGKAAQQPTPQQIALMGNVGQTGGS